MFGASWRAFGASWGIFGTSPAVSVGRFGMSLACLGAPLGSPFRALLGAHLGAFWASVWLPLGSLQTPRNLTIPW